MMEYLKRRKEGFEGERAIFLPYIVIEQIEKEPITAGLHITMIGYYPKARNHYRERPETIPQFILIYCVEGKGWLKMNNTYMEINPNECFIIPAGVAHSYAADPKDPWTIYWIHFKGHLAPDFAEGLDKPFQINPTANSRISDRIDLFEEIFRALKLGYSKQNLQYATTLFYHFMGTIRYLEPFRNTMLRQPDQSDIFATAIHYMKENIEKKLSIPQIAERIGYSVSFLNTLFIKNTGYSPSQYLNLLKIQKACQLLDFSNMKIKQVSYKIGIDDTYYFSRLFKKTMGLSPREYRKQKKG